MDNTLVVRGGIPLSGMVSVYGSKNSASKLMVASLLSEKTSLIENVPLSGEIDITRELCESVGSRVILTPDHRCEIQTKDITTSLVPEMSRKNRIPILAIGPLLHRTGRAEIPFLGGDKIGHRPIDFHIKALGELGVRVRQQERSYIVEADTIRGATIDLPFPSVGATENIILTAALAHGKTLIKNAAVEPEILQLVEMLILMGASIRVEEFSRQIEINGVRTLTGARIRVMPDRNEIVSFVCAILATGGDAYVADISSDYILEFLKKITEIGANFEEKDQGIRFWGKAPNRAAQITTEPHPGFMTDWQQPFSILLTRAQGESIIHETVYEDRFGYTRDLTRMGVDIEITDKCPQGENCRFSEKSFRHVAKIRGPVILHGTEITMTDIRAGMAHIIAALAAGGESVISGIEHIDRGYERIDQRLRALGANIRREEGKGERVK